MDCKKPINPTSASLSSAIPRFRLSRCSLRWLSPRQPGPLLLHSGSRRRASPLTRAGLGRQGVVVLMPAYRGQLRRLDDQRSDGKIEFAGAKYRTPRPVELAARAAEG